MRKLLLCAAIVCFLMFLTLIFTGSFYPKALAFIEPVLCPTGTKLDVENVRRIFSRRNSYIACRAENGEIVYVTGRLLIVASVPLLTSLLLLIAWSRGKSQRELQENERVAVKIYLLEIGANYNSDFSPDFPKENRFYDTKIK